MGGGKNSPHTDALSNWPIGRRSDKLPRPAWKNNEDEEFVSGAPFMVCGCALDDLGGNLCMQNSHHLRKGLVVSQNLNNLFLLIAFEYCRKIFQNIV